MSDLTAKQESFIQKMAENEELARHGFALLIEKDNCETYFDALQAAGLFEPSKNPRPVHVAEQGYVHISYWGALDYLVAVAKLAGQRNDLELANKVMGVVRNVSSWRDEEGKPQENYHTSQKFATVLGLVPTEAVALEDLEFVPAWLSNRFERMLVSRALDEDVLPRFSASGRPEDWEKAVIVLRHCTAIAAIPEGAVGYDGTKTIIEEFWLKRIIANHATSLGGKLGRQTTSVFEQRVREVFSSDVHKQHSEIFRPAVEDHYQNHGFRGAENMMVEGLRDALSSWIVHDPEAAEGYVAYLLTDGLEILRRIGIYSLNKHWSSLNRLYGSLLRSRPFTPGQIHELFGLLENHFREFTPDQQQQTLDEIRSLPEPQWANDAPKALKRQQQKWLSAIVEKGCQAADQWFAELQADRDVGPVPEHPDFNSFMTSGQGPGASRFSAAELVAFAKSNTLAQELNGFRESDDWRGPTIDGLASALQEATRTEAVVFVLSLPDLLGAKPVFQNAILMGLKNAWEAANQEATSDWDGYWGRIIEFIERLFVEDGFWIQDDERRDWVTSAAADLLRAGTQKDEHAYSPTLFSRTLALLAILLDRSTASPDCSDDPMSRAVNTPKGRAVEALFSQALRMCRVSEEAVGNHEEPWDVIAPLFDHEIERCRNANYEFSTLCGAYLPQLDYMSSAWTLATIPEIFPADFPNNDKCAIAGLAYSRFTKSAYEQLIAGGVISRGLRYELSGRDAREKLLERIAVAYLWGLESLDSPRFEYLFSMGSPEDLGQITWVLWSVRNGEMSQDQRERIVLFWERCKVWVERRPSPDGKLLSALSTLAWYLPDANGRNRDLLLSVAPYVHVNNNSYEFIEQLAKLAEGSPDGVVAVLEAMVAAHIPDYDYENRLLDLLRNLAEDGKRVEVISLLERLRSLSGMQELFDVLTHGHWSSTG
jgi:hypothetical protein